MVDKGDGVHPRTGLSASREAGRRGSRGRRSPTMRRRSSADSRVVWNTAAAGRVGRPPAVAGWAARVVAREGPAGRAGGALRVGTRNHENMISRCFEVFRVKMSRDED